MFKKVAFVFFIFILILAVGCQKSPETQKSEDQTKEKKNIKQEKEQTVYTKYRANIYKDKKLNNWLATLAKGEEVTLVDEITQKINQKELELAKIIRADGETTGYIERRHLAGKPIIFANNTDVYDQPTITSNLFTSVKKGKVGFILDKKEEWTKVFVGYVKKDDEKKYVNEKWVKGGFSSDMKQVKNGLLYERAMSKLEDEDSSNDKEALETLEQLSEKQTLVSSLAEKNLLEHEEKTLE